MVAWRYAKAWIVNSFFSGVIGQKFWQRCQVRSVIEYATVSLLSFAVFILGTGRAILNLGSPWGLGDILLGYAFTSAAGVRGEATPHLGFPFGVDLRYFPGTELVLTSAAQALSWVWANPYIGINLVFVLSFPATAAAALLAFRRMGMSPLLRIGLAVAFTAVPFHLYRIEHIYLATLYPLPLGLAIAIMIFDGTFERSAHTSKARWVKTVLLGCAGSLAIAWGGIYWTFFAALLILIAAIMRIIRVRSRLGLWGFLPLVVIAGGVLIALAPTLMISGNDASKTFQRYSFESIIYSGQFIDAVLPATASRIPLVNQIAAPLAQINDWANTAGAIGVRWISDNGTLFTLLGAIALFLWAIRLYPRVSAGKNVGVTGKSVQDYFPFIAVATVVIILFLVPFGLNAYFASAVTPQFRAWDRAVPMLQLLLICVLGLYLTLVFNERWRGLRVKLFAVPLVTLGILTLIVFDSVLPARIYWHNQLDLAGKKQAQAQAVTYSVNEVLGSDCGVLTLPYIRFPESAGMESLGAYDPLWLGLEGRDNRWSVGGIANSVQGDWLAEVSVNPLLHLGELRDLGFCGILLDSRGYTPELFESVIVEFSGELGAGSEVGGETRVVVFKIPSS